MSDSSSNHSTIGGTARIQIALSQSMRNNYHTNHVHTNSYNKSIETSTNANPELYKSVRKALKNQTLNFKINVECTSLKVSPSGNFLWGGFSDGTLRVWDLSGTFGVQEDDVVASRQKSGLLVNSKLTQGYGAVASQIHARGVHTDLITTVDISDDAQYVFMGVSRGAVELHAVFIGDLERAVHKQKQKEELQGTLNVMPPVKRNILDYLKVYYCSDAKLKGFGACATLKNNGTGIGPYSPPSPPSYLLLTGKGIKNIHIWKFTPPTHLFNSGIDFNDNDDCRDLFLLNRRQSICDPPEDEEDNGIWEQLYDTSTNGNTIVLLGFYRNPQQKLLAVSKSGAQKLRMWDLSFEETEEAAASVQSVSADDDSDSSSTRSRSKRPPYQDVENSQQAMDIAGGIGVCGGGTMYNEMSIVSLDRPKDPYNHTELALPSSNYLAGSNGGAYSSRRQRRGEMKAVVNVATSQRDSSHALLELDDGSLVGYSAGSSSISDSTPKLATATPETTGIPALPADFWRRCICLANVSGVVIAASSLYNPNTNKGQLVIRALGGLKKPRGSKIAEKKKQEQLKILKQQQEEKGQLKLLKKQQKEKERQNQLEHERERELQQHQKEMLKLLKKKQKERQEQVEREQELQQQQKERLKVLKQQQEERQEQVEREQELKQKERQEKLEHEREQELQQQKERRELLKQQQKERQEQLERDRELQQQKERLKILKQRQKEKERQEQLKRERESQLQKEKGRLKLLKQQREKEMQEQLKQQRESELQKEERMKLLKQRREKERQGQLERELQHQKEQLKLLKNQQKERQEQLEREREREFQQQQKEQLELLKEQRKERQEQLEREGERKLQQQRIEKDKQEQLERERERELQQQQVVAIPKTPSPSHNGSMHSSPVAADTEALKHVISAPKVVPVSAKKSKDAAGANPKQTYPQTTNTESSYLLTCVSPSADLETPSHSNRVETSGHDESPDSTGKMPKISHFLKPKRIDLENEQQKQPRDPTKKRKAKPKATSAPAAAPTTTASDSPVGMSQLNSVGSILFKSTKPSIKKRKKSTLVNAPTKTKKSAVPGKAPSENSFSTQQNLLNVSSSKNTTGSDRKRDRSAEEDSPVAAVTPKLARTNGDVSKALLMATPGVQQGSKPDTQVKDAVSAIPKTIASISKTKPVVSVTPKVSPSATGKSTTIAKVVSKPKTPVIAHQQQQQQSPKRKAIDAPIKPKAVAKSASKSKISVVVQQHLLNERINEQYKQLRIFLQNFTDQSMKLIHSRNLRGPVPSALDNRKHLDAQSKLLEEHRAVHNCLQKGLLQSAEKVLRLLKESRITPEEARAELKHCIVKFGKILYDILPRQEMERVALATNHPRSTRRLTKNREQPSCESVKEHPNYPCKAAFEKVEDICAAIARPVGRPRSGPAPLRG